MLDFTIHSKSMYQAQPDMARVFISLPCLSALSLAVSSVKLVMSLLPEKPQMETTQKWLRSHYFQGRGKFRDSRTIWYKVLEPYVQEFCTNILSASYSGKWILWPAPCDKNLILWLFCPSILGLGTKRDYHLMTVFGYCDYFDLVPR